MKYSVMTKKNVDDQNKWTFDYFTQEALKKKPRSGIVFRKIPSTRGFVTKCVKYWAGHADDPTPIWKERCWDTYVTDNPNIPDPGTGGCRHCYEEAYLDPDGGGGGGGSGNYTPPEEPEKTPCEKLKEKLKNATFSEKIKELQNYMKGTLAMSQIEKGYMEDIGVGYSSLKAASGTSLNFVTNSKTSIGFIHNHPESYTWDYGLDISKQVTAIPIFSPADIISFLKMVRPTMANGIPTEDIYGTVVMADYVYMLKFTGNPEDIVNIPSANSLKKDYETYFFNIYPNNPEQAFLNFVKDKIPVKGIELMKIDSRGNNSTIILDSQNQIITINCNK